MTALLDGFIFDPGRFEWVEWPGDWAALYRDGKRVWQGHPGDFEWTYHLQMTDHVGDESTLVKSHAPDTLGEAVPL